MKIKRPAFQFYPSDYLKDLALRQCSAEARGVWMDILCLMHEGEPYGHLATIAGPISIKWMANFAGISAKTFTESMAELERHEVFSRTDSRVIFSRRMVRDEEIRNARANGGGKSVEHPNTHKPSVKGGENSDVRVDRRVVGRVPFDGPFDPPPSSSSSSSSSSSTTKSKAEKQPLAPDGADEPPSAIADSDQPPAQKLAVVPKQLSTLRAVREEIALRIWERHPDGSKSDLAVVDRRLQERVKGLLNDEEKIKRMREIDARHARWCASEQWAGKGMVNNLGNWFTKGFCVQEPPVPRIQDSGSQQLFQVMAENIRERGNPF